MALVGSKRGPHAITDGSDHLLRNAKRSRQVEMLRTIYPPLEDPSRQIRLLKAIPNDRSSEMEYEFVVVDFDTDESTPEYYAISYTWGKQDDLQRNIVLNGENFTVRQNCFYALAQARLHYMQAFIWIDAVCIHQDDLSEKGAQVAMMGSVYKQAAWVLVCIGPHCDNSEVVIAWTRRNVELPPPQRGVQTFENHAQIYWQSILELGDLADSLQAFVTFAQRRYWNRVWVAQEIALGTNKAVLCGEDVVPWISMAQIQFILFLLHVGSHPIDVWGPAGSTMGFQALSRFESDPGNVSFDSLLLHFQYLDCQDPRDRIYGILSLARRQDIKDITPDYGISRLELALKMAKITELHAIGSLLEALRISNRSRGIRSMLERRRSDRMVPTTERSSVINRATVSYMLIGCHRWIMGGEQGQLTADIRWDKTHPKEKTGDKSLNSSFIFRHGLGAAFQKYPGLCDALLIQDNYGKVVALVSRDSQPGDLLLEYDVTNLFLVLRPCNDHTYDIVGQGFRLKDYQMASQACLGGTDLGTRSPGSEGSQYQVADCDGSDRESCNKDSFKKERSENEECRSSEHESATGELPEREFLNEYFGPDIEVDLSVEDAVALLAFDIVSEGATLTLTDRLERFRYPITANPYGAARLKPSLRNDRFVD